MEKEGRVRREVILSCLKLPGILSSSQSKKGVMGKAERCVNSRALKSEELSLILTPKSIMWTLGRLKESTGLYSSHL